MGIFAFLERRRLERKGCPECGALYGHSPECSLMDEACAKKMLKEYYNAWLKIETKHRKQSSDANKFHQKKMIELRREIDFWKGKFYVVKHENNQLRKKIEK